MKTDKIRKIYEGVPESALTARDREVLALLDEEVLDFDLPAGRYRILQFETENFAELAENLSLLLPEIVKISEDYAVELESRENLTKSELLEVLDTLSQDLSEPIRAYVGVFSDQSELAKRFKEEQAIFEAGRTFSEHMLHTGLSLVESELLEQIRQQLKLNPDDQELVRVLYQAGGNQSQAAKALYMHRNTLLNKIKKYEQKYGLQLTGSDLILAYNML